MYKLIELTQKDIPNYLEIGKKNAPCVLYGIHDKHFIWECSGKNIDEREVENSGIDVKQLSGAGGTIVCSKGDLDFGFFGTEEFCYEMYYKVSELVSKKLYDGKILNNDFMYGDNKYGSMTSINFGDVFYIGVHISNNIDNELIDKICLKKTFKKPTAMPIQISKEDVLKLFGGEVQ